MHKQIIKRHSQDKDNDNHNNVNLTFPSSDVTQLKGFKKGTCLTRQSHKRHKSWVEKKSIATKRKSPPKRQSCSQASKVSFRICNLIYK